MSENSVFNFGRIDSFPTLENYTGTSSNYDRNKHVFKTSYYNKLASCVETIEGYLSVTETASGVGGIQRLSFVYSLSAPFSLLLKSFTNAAYYNQNFPGNVLPFEFIITSSADKYPGWVFSEAGYSLYIHATDLDLLLGGLPVLSNNLVTAGLEPTKQLDTILMAPHGKWVVNCYTAYDSDTIAIRGCIINYDITDMTLTSNKWINPDYKLVVSLMGVQ